MLFHWLLQSTRMHKCNKLILWPRLTNTYTKGNTKYPLMSFILAYFWACLFASCIKLHYMIFGDLLVIKKDIIYLFLHVLLSLVKFEPNNSSSRVIVIK